MTKQLKYIGGRVKPFTAKCPSGARYPVEPEVSRIIEVTEADALHLLGNQPALWQPADVELTPLIEQVDEYIPPTPSIVRPPKEKAK